MSKLFLLVSFLSLSQFVKAQCDTNVYKKDAIFYINMELQKKYNTFSDSLYIESLIPIFQLKQYFLNDSLKNHVDFSVFSENQAFIVKSSPNIYSGYIVKEIEKKRQQYNEETWYLNQELPIKALKEDCFIDTGFNLFGLTNYEQFMQLTDTLSVFFIYDIPGIWTQKENELIHIQQVGDTFVCKDGQVEFEEYLQKNGYDCFKVLIDGWSNCGKSEVIFMNPDVVPPPQKKIRKSEKFTR